MNTVIRVKVEDTIPKCVKVNFMILYKVEDMQIQNWSGHNQTPVKYNYHKKRCPKSPDCVLKCKL